MADLLKGKRVAVIATDGVEQSEFTEPVKALQQEGASVSIISLKKGPFKAWNHKDWGETFNADLSIEDANSEDFDGLVLPGGVMNPDKLRTNERVIAFATEFIDRAKPVAAICHGPWTLIETGKLQGRNMTSYPSIRTDLINAGVNWTDEEVVVDNGLVTSRNPGDLPAFCKKMIEEIREGRHQ